MNMKKHVLLLSALVVSAAVWAYEKTLSSEPFTCTDDWSGYVTLEKALFASAVPGDEINIYVTECSSTAYPQVYLQYVDAAWAWKDFTDPHTYSLTGKTMPHKASIRLTQTMIDLVNGGLYLVVKGAGYTAEQITLTHTPEDIGTTVSIWKGSVVMPSNWGKWQTLTADLFAEAQAGQLLRIRFTDAGGNAQLQLKKTSDWSEMTDAPLAQISGRYYDYTITADMLAELQARGVHVSGCSYTLTEVMLVNPADLQPLNLSVPVKDQWVYTAQPAVTVRIGNPYDQAVTAVVEMEITTDKAQPVETIRLSEDIAAGESKEVVLTPSADMPAGFYKATCIVNDDLARAFVFGVNPTAIVSAPDKQADFESYWAAAKAQLESIPMNATLTEIPSKSTANRKVYLVEMQSVPDGLTGEPVTIRGYYAEPQDGKKHPVIMHYQGYDSGYRPGGEGNVPWCLSGDGETHYAEFILSTRGQSVNNRPAADREDGIERDFTNTYGDWFAFRFGDKDAYYYRGAYMDCVQAVRFMASRPTSDMSNLFAEGQSQGGAFTYAAASLSDYPFRAIAPGIAFMGDFPDYFEIVNWPAYVARQNQESMTDEQMYAFLSYYDTKNLAATIACPVIACIGLQDNVCPPHTNIAPYNNLLSTDKTLIFNPENAHQAGSTWYNDYMAFFKAHEQEQGLTKILAETPANTIKGINDGLLVIVRDGREYTVLGQVTK